MFINQEYFDAFQLGIVPSFAHGHEDIDASLNYTIVSAERFDCNEENPVDISSQVSQLGKTFVYSTIWNIGEISTEGIYRVRTIIKTPAEDEIIELNSIITIQE